MTDDPSPLPPPQARTHDDEEKFCKTCGRPTKITITSQGICVGSCPDCEQPFVNYGSPAPLKPTTCLLCNWEWDQEKNTHIPEIMESISGVYVCGECYTRCKTVDSFGLTVEDLRIAARNYKAGAASAPQEAGTRMTALKDCTCTAWEAGDSQGFDEDPNCKFHAQAWRDAGRCPKCHYTFKRCTCAERGVPLEEKK